jgi:transitional endoplasmic reticulum ATPase
MKHPESFKRMGIRAPRGILLYGPPGTGKTLLARAVAKESEANFIQVKGPSLLSMWVGKSEEGVRKIFERARQVSPCIIFFDEIDSLAGKRGMDNGQKVTERVLNQLLAEMDGLEEMNDVLIIGATNRPDMLDAALLRPGRFDKILLVNAPGVEGRETILKIHTRNMPLAKNINLKKIAEDIDGFTGADIEGLVREAAMIALREDIHSKEVSKKNFDEALNKINPSITKRSIETYKKMEESFIKSARSATDKKEEGYLG